MQFNDWFHELQHDRLRSENFYHIMDAYTHNKFLADKMVEWLQSAYEMGRVHMKEQAVNTAESFKTKMDAGKEHIVVALEKLK